MEEVTQHNNAKDCWVVLYGNAYDLTKFARVHPGGAKIITDNAGRDATALFDPIHPKDIMERLLKPEMKLGPVDPRSILPEHVVLPPEKKKAAPKNRARAALQEKE